MFLFCPGKNGKSCKGIVKMQKDSAVAEKNTFQNFENIVKSELKKEKVKYNLNTESNYTVLEYYYFYFSI